MSALGSLNAGTRSAIVAVPGGRVFVKANEVPHRHEAGRYRALEGSGVPTPHLLHAMVLPPVEILVLECLDRIGISFGSDGEILELLRVVAALNAVRPEVPLAADPGTPQAEFEVAVRSALRTVAGGDLDRWWAAYRRAVVRVDAMPTALCHGELYFQQVGWTDRGGRATLVVFDLETLAYRPRFSDIASILYALSAETGRSQEELLSVYLDELQQQISVEAALEEVRLVRWVDACWGLPWMLRQHAAAPGSVPLESTLACMREDVSATHG